MKRSLLALVVLVLAVVVASTSCASSSRGRTWIGANSAVTVDSTAQTKTADASNVVTSSR